jgi:hypothetical protein
MAVGTLGLLLAARAAWSLPALADLQVEQVISKTRSGYEALPSVKIAFSLGAPAEVTVWIGRHLAATQQNQSEYVADPYLVRTLKLGRLAAGPHEVTWNGLGERGQRVTETQVVPPKTSGAASKGEPLTRQTPVNLFRITVEAPPEKLSANFRRLEGMVDASRSFPAFGGAVQDGRGNLYLAERATWRGRRYASGWRLDQTYPRSASAQAQDPVECYDVALDSQGNLCLMAPSGVYRYDPAGNPLPWTANEPYVNYPYAFPGVTSNVLGVRFNPKAAPETDAVKPTGEAAKMDPSELVRKPGFAYQWGGMAIDKQDNLYLGRVDPNPEIQVFDATGKYLRSIALPGDAAPYSLRVGTDGALWVAGGKALIHLSPAIGGEPKVLDVPVNFLHVGADGSVYGVNGGELWRVAPSGELIPFSVKAPYVRENGQFLDLRPVANNVPEDTAGYAAFIHGIVAGEKDFYLSVSPSDAPDAAEGRLLHFSADGTFLPDTLSASLGQHRPGNVFVDSDPPMFDLLVNNLSEKEQPLTADWVLTDFDGKATKGSLQFIARPLQRQRVPLIPDAGQMGHYRFAVTLRQGDQVVTTLNTQLARIRSRRLTPEEYSPFAMCWGTDFYLMGLAGVKTERVGSAYWGKIEPLEGISMPDPKEAIQWPDSLEGYRKYADRWSVALPEGFSYGEPWLGGSFPGCRIFSYDRFYRYCMRVVDKFGGRGVPHYQFWNEPNYFWRVPGPFSREHFALVAKHTWSIVKARDKNARAICDGDAGSTRMMEELALYGANLYNDTIQIHYPGAQAAEGGQLKDTDQPEGRLPMLKDLVAIRDRYYPGKPIWNTEEGWWGAKTKSPEIGATVIPRIYIPQMAAGVDRIFWFAQSSVEDPTYLLDGDSAPNPAYCSYATMTRLLEGAEYMGAADLGPGTMAHLFSQGSTVILAAWSTGGEKQVLLDAGADRAGVTDLMDRQSDLRAVAGKLPLTLSERVQYISFPRTAWAAGIAKADLTRRLSTLKVGAVSAIPLQIAEATRTAPTDPQAMSRLFYLIQAARQAALAGDSPQVEQGTEAVVKGAREEVDRREGADGYLRQARVALNWTNRLFRAAQRQGGAVAGGLAWASVLAARATSALAGVETPAYPGVVVNAYLEPRSVRQNADPAQPLDEKFPFEIERKAGSSFELELTVWNYYRHPIAGVVEPRLPAGWKATPERTAYAIEPGKFERYVYTVTVPGNTAPGLYPVGGVRNTASQSGNEIHTQRVRVTR